MRLERILSADRAKISYLVGMILSSLIGAWTLAPASVFFSTFISAGFLLGFGINIAFTVAGAFLGTGSFLQLTKDLYIFPTVGTVSFRPSLMWQDIKNALRSFDNELLRVAYDVFEDDFGNEMSSAARVMASVLPRRHVEAPQNVQQEGWIKRLTNTLGITESVNATQQLHPRDLLKYGVYASLRTRFSHPELATPEQFEAFISAAPNQMLLLSHANHARSQLYHIGIVETIGKGIVDGNQDFRRAEEADQAAQRAAQDAISITIGAANRH